MRSFRHSNCSSKHGISLFFPILGLFYLSWIRIRIRIQIRIHRPDWIRIQSGSGSGSKTLVKRALCDNRIFLLKPFFRHSFSRLRRLFSLWSVREQPPHPLFVAHYPGFEEKEVRIQLKYQRTCENIFLHVTLSFSKGLFIYQWRKRLSASGR